MSDMVIPRDIAFAVAKMDGFNRNRFAGAEN